MEEISIKKVKEEEIKNFAKKEWAVINKRFNFIPFRKTFFFATYLDKKLVGYAKVHIMGGLAEIAHIIIKDEMTDLGIGSKIMSFIETWAKKKNCRKIVLETAEKYKKTIKFYKKHGYKIDAVLPNYYYGCDWYYMSKDIKKVK